MSTSLIITTTYHNIPDVIWAHVTLDDDAKTLVAVVVLAAYDDSAKIDKFDRNQEVLDQLPIANPLQLIAIVLNALIDATTEDTEIPMCFDEPITVEI